MAGHTKSVHSKWREEELLVWLLNTEYFYLTSPRICFDCSRAQVPTQLSRLAGGVHHAKITLLLKDNAGKALSATFSLTVRAGDGRRVFSLFFSLL